MSLLLKVARVERPLDLSQKELDSLAVSLQGNVTVGSSFKCSEQLQLPYL